MIPVIHITMAWAIYTRREEEKRFKKTVGVCTIERQKISKPTSTSDQRMGNDWKKSEKRDEDEQKKERKKEKTHKRNSPNREEYNHNKVIQSVESMFRICSAHHFPSIHSEMRQQTNFNFDRMVVALSHLKWGDAVDVGGARLQMDVCGDIAEEKEEESEKKSNRISKRLKFVGGCEHYASIILIHTYRSLNRRYGKKRRTRRRKK